MATATPVNVFVCGPTLNGEMLSGLLVRDGAVIWEGGAEPAPQPLEPIRAVHHVPIEGFDRLVLVVTNVGLYLSTVDDLIAESSASPNIVLMAQDEGVISIA